MLKTRFPTWPSFSIEEANAARDVLLSNAVNYWTGNECRKFEQEFATWIGSRYAVCMSNGTVALDAALHAIELRDGDEVIVTPRTFIASASSVVMAGAIPIFADVDADTQNLTAESIEAKLTPRSKAIICVHLAGMPCDMEPIMKLADDRGLVVIEDCAQAHGARYKGKSVGSIGHIGTWSFCQDKIMSTGGEGGMVTTDNAEYWSKMWSYKDHGKSWSAVYEQEHAPGFRWLHESIGTNGRMLEIQASIGRIQLRRMAEWTAARRKNARRILEAASALQGLRVPAMPLWAEHAEYKCYVFVDESHISSGWNRDRIMAEINDLGVPCYSGSCSEVYKEKAFIDRGLSPSRVLPVAKELGETSLMFLVHPTLQDEHIDRTCEVLTTVMEKATVSSTRCA